MDFKMTMEAKWNYGEPIDSIISVCMMPMNCLDSTQSAILGFCRGEFSSFNCDPDSISRSRMLFIFESLFLSCFLPGISFINSVFKIIGQFNVKIPGIKVPAKEATSPPPILANLLFGKTFDWLNFKTFIASFSSFGFRHDSLLESGLCLEAGGAI